MSDFDKDVRSVTSSLSLVYPGCDSGACTIWMAAQGCDAIGIDLVPAAIKAAKAKAEIEGSTAQFVQADIFDLPQELLGNFDFVYDSQCFHCLRMHDEAAAVVAIASLMKQGAHLLVLTGNDREPEVGPAVLSKEELEGAFVGSGLFRVVDIREGRFDTTEHYATLPSCPLAWEAVFQRM